jgi:HEAT repeat protein
LNWEIPMKNLLAACLCLALSGAAVARAQGDKKGPAAPDGLKSLKHPDPTVRYNSAALLVQLGPVAKFAIPALHEALQDTSPRVRVKVAEALWGIERPPARVLLPVLQGALKDKDAAVRINALAVLGQIGKAAKAAIPDIARALEDKEMDVRMEAALTLGEMGPAAKSTIPALLAALQGDELRLLEPLVAVTLGNIGPSAVPALQQALAGKDARLRRTAAYALTLIGPKAAPARGVLTEALADAEADVRALAAKALGRIGAEAKDALPKLHAALTDRDAAVRVNAALALWQIDASAAGLPVLTAALKEPQAFVREQACAALGTLGPKAAPAAPELLQTMADREARVRALCADALGKLPHTKAIRARLTEALTDRAEDVRVSAARGLWSGAEASERAKLVQTLAAALESESTMVRKRAAQLLGEFGPAARAAVPALLQSLRDRENAVREAAEAALRQIDPKAAAKAGVR